MIVGHVDVVSWGIDARCQEVVNTTTDKQIKRKPNISLNFSGGGNKAASDL